MTDEFSVDLEQLDNVVTRLSSLTAFISDHLTTLDQKVAAVHAGSWSGAAAAAHQQAHSEWSAAAAEFVDGVAEMSSAARNAHGQYTSSVNANTRMFGRR
ncbi:WXG100 family type VII secretion target [Nocardia sp. NPDC051570]|uniref:WXG100 family type VII secretion target n=1 Tax=Nocardia sp. NPDC051570 TaxID=3364324 RepID=UPI0037B1B942